MGYITIYDEVYKARRPGFQNVKKQCEFKHLKEATVNWLPYLVFQACFMTSNSKICSSSAKTIVVSEPKSTLRNNKFSSWRRENAQCCLQNEDGVEDTLAKALHQKRYIIYITFLVKLRFLYREHTCLFYISISTQHSTQCLFCCIKTCPVWLKGMSLCRHSTCTADIIRCPIRFQLSSDIYIYIYFSFAKFEITRPFTQTASLISQQSHIFTFLSQIITQFPSIRNCDTPQ